MRNQARHLRNSHGVPAEIHELKRVSVESVQGVRIGRFVSVEESGRITVDYPGNRFGSLAARSVVNISLEDKGEEALIAFEKNDPRLPLVIGIIRKRPVAPAEKMALDRKEIKDIIVDGEKIVFDAAKEIELRCGESSIKMRSDGVVIIKGDRIVSRARGVNKIKGAAVTIN